MDKKRSKFESETFKQLIGGSTASNACSMQGYKNEKEIVKSSRNSTGSMSVCNSLWKYSFHYNRR